MKNVSKDLVDAILAAAETGVPQSQAKAEAAYLEFAKIDPMDVAERIVGDPTLIDHNGRPQSYKTFDQGQQMRMLGVHMAHNQHKTTLLEAAGDTVFSSKVPQYLNVVHAMGFERVYEEEFVRWSKYDKEPHGTRKDMYYMYVYRELGIVLSFDTYTSGYDGSYPDGKLHTSINSGKWFAVWKPHPELGNGRYGLTSSGHWDSLTDPQWREKDDSEFNRDELVWIGHWDAREGLKSHINACRENGTFITDAWPKLRKLPFGFFNCGADWHSKEYEEAKEVSYFGASSVTDRVAAERRARIMEQNPWMIDFIGHVEQE